MRTFILIATAMLGTTLVTACDERRSPTAPADPHTPGFVERGPSEFGFGFDDGQRVLFAGLTLESLTSLFCAGTPLGLDQLRELAVVRPDGSVKQQFRGEANVVVIDAPPEVGLTCDGVLTAPHLTGTAHVVLNDNDLEGSRNGANAVHLKVVGSVTDESGQPFNLVASIRGVLSSPSGLLDRVRTTIHLTPAGR